MEYREQRLGRNERLLVVVTTAILSNVLLKYKNMSGTMYLHRLNFFFKKSVYKKRRPYALTVNIIFGSGTLVISDADDEHWILHIDSRE